MDPLTAVAILSGLGSIGGLFVNDNDPNAGARERFALGRQFFGPNAIAADAAQYYNLFRRSPAYAHAAQQIRSGAQGAQRGLARSFASRGLTGTGIGASLPLGRAAGGLGLANLSSQAWQQALESAFSGAQLVQGGAQFGRDPRGGFADKYAALNNTLAQLLLVYGNQRK